MFENADHYFELFQLLNYFGCFLVEGTMASLHIYFALDSGAALFVKVQIDLD